MTFNESEDNELLALYDQRASLLKEAVEKQLEYVFSEHQVRDQAILTVCWSRGLVSLNVFIAHLGILSPRLS